MQEYWFFDGCEHQATIKLEGASCWCWAVQEIRGKAGLPHGNQTGYHIRIQRSESIFVSTESCPLGGGNENFEVSEESSRKRTSLFRSWTHLSSMFLRCGLVRVPFWWEIDHMILSFLNKILISWKSKNYSVVSQSSAVSEYNDKWDISVNLNQIFIDRDWFPLRVSHETIWW